MRQALKEIYAGPHNSKGKPYYVGQPLGAEYLTDPNNKNSHGFGMALLDAYANDIVMIDADGTYPVEAIPAMLDELTRCDMVIGARRKEAGTLRWLRTPAKEFIRRLAEFMTGSRIPDLNSGLRAQRRDATLRFDDIAHNVTKFEIIPAGHNRRADLPKGFAGDQTPAQPSHMVDWLNCIRTRGTPKCSTDEAFIETATFLMSLKAQKERRMVRWDAAREEIV